MNLDHVAGRAVEALVERLSQSGPTAADQLIEAITRRLAQTRTGSRSLEALRQTPHDPQTRLFVADALRDELGRDPRFEAELRAALHLPASEQNPATGQRAGIQMGSGNTFRGDVAGGNIDRSKRYHIGSIRFGTGGLVSLIVAGVVAAGGTTGVIYAVTKDGGSVRLEQAVGTWTQDGGASIGGNGGPGMTQDGTILTVSADGGYTYQAGMTFSGVPDRQAPNVKINCIGRVTVDGDTFVFNSHSSGCQTFRAKLAEDGQALQTDNGNLIKTT